MIEDGAMLLTRPDTSVALLMVTFVVGCVLAVASWVYRDARAHAASGSPIVYSVGSLQIRTPAAWFVACTLLFELFIPVYLENRRPA
jgi:Flp pilus assembly protein protease CpaA